MRLLDRRRDLVGWLVTPLVTVAAAPLLACTAGIVATIAMADHTSQSPALCKEAVLDNRCEETILAIIGMHVTIFAGIWLLLWIIPWWRGLRVPRVMVAVAATVVLALLAVRMAA